MFIFQIIDIYLARLCLNRSPYLRYVLAWLGLGCFFITSLSPKTLCKLSLALISCINSTDSFAHMVSNGLSNFSSIAFAFHFIGSIGIFSPKQKSVNIELDVVSEIPHVHYLNSSLIQMNSFWTASHSSLRLPSRPNSSSNRHAFFIAHRRPLLFWHETQISQIKGNQDPQG